MVYIGIETDMAQPPSTSTVLKFDAYALDLRAGELFKNGKKIKIQEQPVQILAMLLERPGEVVTREELRERLWSEDTFVDFEHSLNTAIKKLRLALNDDPEKPRFIETLRPAGLSFRGGGGRKCGRGRATRTGGEGRKTCIEDGGDRTRDQTGLRSGGQSIRAAQRFRSRQICFATHRPDDTEGTAEAGSGERRSGIVAALCGRQSVDGANQHASESAGRAE